MNYETYVDQFFELDEYTDKNISKIISKIYTDVDCIDHYDIVNKTMEIIMKFRSILQKSYQSLCLYLDDVLEGDIPADIQIKMRSIQHVLKYFENDEYLVRIANISLLCLSARSFSCTA